LYLGAEAPKEDFIWQDPIPIVNHKLIDASDTEGLKIKILQSGLTISELVRTAWASAASFRGTDLRGGANGARIRLAPEKNWPVNNPDELFKTLARLEDIQKAFNQAQSNEKKVSLADLIVLGGAAAVEEAAKTAGYTVNVPFIPGRMDASQEQTDETSFAVLEPTADAFRNYFGQSSSMSPTEMLVDKANMLKLTVPEMTVLIGGLRVLKANSGQSNHGVFTNKNESLSNDFFINLLDMSTKWRKSPKSEELYEGVDRKTGEMKWTATSVDLIFGSHSELRAISEVYASEDGKKKFVTDFVNAWNKVMTLDRFDLK
jgi:catalase-peroxidase